MAGGSLAGDGIYHDPLTMGWQVGYAYRAVLFDRQMPFQRVTLLDTHAFGRALFLDGDLNSATRDEFIYHEALVHPAMVRAAAPRRVLIIGGGEGGTLREVLRWSTVEQAVMVDIDGALVELCRTHLRDVYGDPFADRRARLHIGDGRAFVERHVASGADGFDVIVLDLPHPTAKSPVRWLHTREFYRALKHALRPGGVVIGQAGAVDEPSHRQMHGAFGAVFGEALSMEMFVPSFCEAWAFVLGGVGLGRTAQVDAALAAGGVEGLRAYGGEVDRRMATLLPHVRAGLAGGGAVSTDALLAAEGVPWP